MKLWGATGRKRKKRVEVRSKQAQISWADLAGKSCSVSGTGMVEQATTSFPTQAQSGVWQSSPFRRSDSCGSAIGWPNRAIQQLQLDVLFVGIKLHNAFIPYAEKATPYDETRTIYFFFEPFMRVGLKYEQFVSLLK